MKKKKAIKKVAILKHQNMIDASEAIRRLSASSNVGACFVSATIDECNFPIPTIIIQDAHGQLVDLILSIDANGRVGEYDINRLVELFEGKRVARITKSPMK